MKSTAKFRHVQTPCLPFIVPRIDIFPFKKALMRAIRACPKSREQLADDIGAILRKRVRVDHLNSWTAPSKPDHLPRAFELAAFIIATGDPSPLDALAAPVGAAVIGPKDLEVLRLAKLRRDRDALDAEIEALSKRIAHARMSKERANG